MVPLLELMEEDIKENGKTTKWMRKECLSGKKKRYYYFLINFDYFWVERKFKGSSD